MELLLPELFHAVSITPLKTPSVPEIVAGGNWEFPQGHSEFPESLAGSLSQSPRGGALGLNSQSVELAPRQLRVNL